MKTPKDWMEDIVTDHDLLQGVKAALESDRSIGHVGSVDVSAVRQCARGLSASTVDSDWNDVHSRDEPERHHHGREEVIDRVWPIQPGSRVAKSESDNAMTRRVEASVGRCR